MDDKRRNRRRELKWSYDSGENDRTLGIVSFCDLVRRDYITRLVDRSIIGVGLESVQPIQPGIIWFKETVYGQKCGKLMWCKQVGGRYRSGVRFLSLMRTEEEHLRHIVEQAKPYKTIQDPDRIIARLAECISTR